MPSERMVELSGRTVARIYKLGAADDFIRHNVRRKKKDPLLVNVDYAVGINPTAQSHNQGDGS